MTEPTLILIGEARMIGPLERWREMVRHSRTDGTTIALTVYPGGYHAFDAAQFEAQYPLSRPLTRVQQAAAKDAEVKPRAFLAPISAARRRAKRKPAMSTFPRAEFQT
jgi:dienelactone hydrolase